MAFPPPNFNLKCNTYLGVGGGTYVPWLLDLPCYLSPGKRIMLEQATGAGLEALGRAYPMQELGVPALTDLHCEFNGWPECDVVECPAGTGRWYFLQHFVDVGKGWPNEYRLGFMTPIGNAIVTDYPFLAGTPSYPWPWPTP